MYNDKTEATITPSGDGKFDVTWPVCTARAKDGRIITGRPATVAALTGGAKTYNHDDVFHTYATRAEAEAQL